MEDKDYITRFEYEERQKRIDDENNRQNHRIDKLETITDQIAANAVKDEFAKRENKKMTQKTVTLDEFLNERGDFVKQVVYKIDGDYVGDIKGENVTVILMGDGNFKGDINSKNGTVFLNKGNVIGDIKADKVLCPTNKVKPNCRMCKSYMAECARTGQIFCYQHGLLKNPVPCFNFVKRDQL